MLHYCYCQHSQNIILGFWDVSEFCDKLRMSVRRKGYSLTLTHVVKSLPGSKLTYVTCLSICQKLPDPDLPKTANGNGKRQLQMANVAMSNHTTR